MSFLPGIGACAGLIGGGAAVFDGAFSTVDSAATVASSTRTATSGGTVIFTTLAGFGTPEYQKNGGSWTAITEGLAVFVAAGGTLAVRATSLLSTQVRSFTMTSAGRLIENVELERT